MTDIQSKMAEILRTEVQNGDFVPSLLAQKVHDRLLEEDPEFLNQWLSERAVSFIAAELQRLLGSQRAIAMHRRGPGLFADAIQTGDLSIFDARFSVDSARTSRRLGDMTGSDHLYVAERYRRSGNTSLMLAEFHAAVAKKVGDRRTEEIFSASELAKLQKNVLEAFTEQGKTG